MPAAYEPDNIFHLELPRIIELCSKETQYFFKQVQTDTVYCYELFRRAFVGNHHDSQLAWEALFEIYNSLVSHWVQEHPAFTFTEQTVDVFVNCAFGNLWQSLRKPGRFQNFVKIGQLLNYLKACARSCVRDEARKVGRYHLETDLSDQELRLDEVLVSNDKKVEQKILEKESRKAIFRRIGALLKNEKEQIVFVECFEWNLKPRNVHKRHLDIFQEPLEISRIKRNLIERFGRDPYLESIYEDRL